MIRLPAVYFVITILALAWRAEAQTPLTLANAIGRARAQNFDAGSIAAAERAAAARIPQAQAGYWPRVDVVESWQRSNQPVFVFSSLLAQRQFTAANFALAALNHPDAIDNVRTAATVEQSLFDGTIKANVAAARIGGQVAGAQVEINSQDLAVRVTEAYGRVLSLSAQGQLAAAAVEAARADRKLAGDRRDAGRATDADVLQIELFVSRALEQQIRVDADAGIARAQLNLLIGEPLESTFALAPVELPDLAITDVASLEAEAIANRPAVRLAVLRQQLAAATEAQAQAAFLPRVVAQGGWELNSGASTAGAPSWAVGAEARINVFHGFVDKARLAESREQVTERALARRQAEGEARLDVRVALARLTQARASENVGRAAVEQARESRRIIRDRYEAGLADVASLLRAAENMVEAEVQQTAARVAVLNGAAVLQRALGRQ